MKWSRDSGVYRAELEDPGGTIKLKCFDSLGIAERKWAWAVEWPGGQIARGSSDTLAVCKEMCETAAHQYEPHGEVFRRKPECG